MYSPSNNSQALGKLYYVKTGERTYITVRSSYNALSRKMEAQIANEVTGIPPAGIPEMDKKTFNLVRTGKVKGHQVLDKSN